MVILDDHWCVNLGRTSREVDRMKKNQAPKPIIRVHHPDITPEERARRMELIRKAAVDLIIATERNKRTRLAAEKGT